MGVLEVVILKKAVFVSELPIIGFSSYEPKYRRKASTKGYFNRKWKEWRKEFKVEEQFPPTKGKVKISLYPD